MSESMYIMARNYKGSIRLNCQHWCSNVRNGFLLHPAISLPENAIIADVGTGTGAWIFELAPKLPPSTSFDAIDIDFSQLPHEQWLPKNVKGVKLDLYDPIPSSLQQKYDLLHIRYFAVCVKNSDPGPVIKQVKKMVKPGGYIQWTDIDLWGDKLAKVSPDLKSSSTEKLHQVMNEFLEPRFGSSPGWTPSIPKLLKEEGLTEIATEYHTPTPDMWPALHDNFLKGWEEVSEFAPNGAEMRALLDEAKAEFVASNRGLAVVGHALTTVSQVPNA